MDSPFFSFYAPLRLLELNTQNLIAVLGGIGREMYRYVDQPAQASSLWK
jgi:hypothetical protein